MNLCEELCELINEGLKEHDQDQVVDSLRLLHTYVRGRLAMKLPLNCGDFDSFLKTVREAAETLDYKTVMKFIDGREW